MNGTRAWTDSNLPRFLVIAPHGACRLEAGLEPFLALGCPIVRSASLAGAEPGAEPDLVLFDLACGAEELRATRARFPGALVMVAGPPALRQCAEQALAAGADEWLRTGAGGGLDQERAFDAIERLLLLGPRPALPRVRHARASVAALLSPSPAAGASASEASAVPAEGGEHNLDPAPDTSARVSPLKLYEVAADGGPERRVAPELERGRVLGGCLELSLRCREPLVARTVLVGFEGAGGLVWDGFRVRRLSALGGERHALELELERGPRDFFRERALLPTLDPAHMRYEPPELGERARAWAELGVLREAELDRVLVCPRCQALPTFRLSCLRCGSARMDGQRLIHHFPCAHVGFVKDYQLDGLLICPKCSARPLIVNSDFEYLDGPAVCAECGSSEGPGELVGHCFGCGLRFLARLAATLVLKGYHADRLDPLALGLPA